MVTVLVVDDSPVDQKLVGGVLKGSPQFKVEFANDGHTALARILESPPQLVLTDMVMPGMDGLELVAQVAMHHPQIPIVLMTGEGNESTAVRALQAGASSYVPKSSLASDLVETLQSVLDAARDEQSQSRLFGAIVQSSTSFQIENDFSMIPPLVQYVHRCVRSVRLCDESSGIRVSIAMEEALNNAIFHGNLELDSSLREGDRGVLRELIESRQTTRPHRDRRVFVECRVTPREGMFIVRDEGAGFDPSTLPDPTDPANLDRVCGRGLLLMRTFMDELHFNGRGNEVTMIKHAAETA